MKTKSGARGLATIELALVFPLLLALVLGIIEFAWQFHVLHCMNNAARDAARLLAIKGGSAQQASELARSELGDFDATFSVVAQEPSSGEGEVRVEILVPRSEILFGFLGSSSGNLRSSATMRKERE